MIAVIASLINQLNKPVRLLTYAMLIKQGFNVDVGRIINPTAIFCINRDDYYAALARADEGTEEGLLFWCEYMLKGLKQEIEKIDNLLDYTHLKEKILQPAIVFSLDRGVINEIEAKILRKVVEKQVIQASDVNSITGSKVPATNSRVLRQLRDKKMIAPETTGGRKYIINFINSYLLRGIIKSLSNNGFLPLKE